MEFLTPYIPHGVCFKWNQYLMFLHIFSDSLIGIVYLGISGLSYPLIKKIEDATIRRLYILFGLFIFFCGLTHLLEILNIWMGLYWINGSVKLITAIISILAFNRFFPFLNELVARPSAVNFQNIKNKLNYLQNQIQYFSDLSQHCSGLLVITDNKYKIKFANSNFLETLGYSLEEILGKSLYDFSCGFIPIHETESFNNEINNNGKWHGEIINYTKSGESIQCIATMILIRNGLKEKEGYVSIFYDLNQFKNDV